MEHYRVYSINLAPIANMLNISASAAPKSRQDADMLYSRSQVLIGIITTDEMKQYHEQVDEFMRDPETKEGLNRVFVCQHLDDFKTPSQDDLLLFFAKVIKAMDKESGNLSIHCGAGCGRSGTYIVALKVLEIALHGEIDDNKIHYEEDISNDDGRSPYKRQQATYTKSAINAMKYGETNGLGENGVRVLNREYLETGDQLTAISELSEHLALLVREDKLLSTLKEMVSVELVGMPVSTKPGFNRISSVFKPGSFHHMQQIDELLFKIDEIKGDKNLSNIVTRLSEKEQFAKDNLGQNLLHIFLSESISSLFNQTDSKKIIMTLAKARPTLLAEKCLTGGNLSPLSIISSLPQFSKTEIELCLNMIPIDTLAKSPHLILQNLTEEKAHISVLIVDKLKKEKRLNTIFESKTKRGDSVLTERLLNLLKADILSFDHIPESLLEGVDNGMTVKKNIEGILLDVFRNVVLSPTNTEPLTKTVALINSAQDNVSKLVNRVVCQDAEKKYSKDQMKVIKSIYEQRPELMTTNLYLVFHQKGVYFDDAAVIKWVVRDAEKLIDEKMIDNSDSLQLAIILNSKDLFKAACTKRGGFVAIEVMLTEVLAKLPEKDINTFWELVKDSVSSFDIEKLVNEDQLRACISFAIVLTSCDLRCDLLQRVYEKDNSSGEIFKQWLNKGGFVFLHSYNDQALLNKFGKCLPEEYKSALLDLEKSKSPTQLQRSTHGGPAQVITGKALKRSTKREKPKNKPGMKIFGGPSGSTNA